MQEAVPRTVRLGEESGQVGTKIWRFSDVRQGHLGFLLKQV